MKNLPKKNICSQMRKLANITKELIIKGNIPRAKYCLQMAERIFTVGNQEIKNATLDVYMASLHGFMKIHHCNIKGLFPTLLQNEYNKQINTPKLWQPLF